MKVQNIRHGVFETNSSSTHSISIDSTDILLDTLEVRYDGKVLIGVGEFGWEQDEHRDAATKASYLHMYCRDWVHPEDLKEKFYQNLKEVILEQTKADDVIFSNDPDGYIDHQSVEDKDYHYIMEDKEKIKNFIFNKKSILVTDNDNH